MARKTRIERERSTEADAWLPVADPAREPDQPATALPIVDEKLDPALFLGDPLSKGQRLRFRSYLALEKPAVALQRALRAERDGGAAFLWAPVCLGLGCVVYFNLPREPLIFAFPLVALIAFFLVWWIGAGHWITTALSGAALIAGGATLAQLHTHAIDTAMLSRTTIATVSGTVTRAERRANGGVRYTIAVDAIDLGRRSTKRKPKAVRLTARKGGPLIHVGEGISGRARMGPPPGPSYPGGYDFSFQTWFDGIGASGFFLGAPKAVAVKAGSSGLASWLKLNVGKVRGAMSGLIRETVPGQGGALAAALIIGDRSGIDDETADILRRSGLAHILAISGLHMALVAATVMYLLRSLLSCFPAVALTQPIRKWAACGALFAATSYLILSGASVSSRRAYVMVAIMLVAILLDRRALTMRNVAIAAVIVLILSPEAVLGPGFQMSFAAVAALVATYEVLRKRRENRPQIYREGLMGFAHRFILRDMGSLATTSLVAGTATALFAAYHFHRVAPFGLIANLLAMPLVSLAVMPLALVSVLAMPFGLESWPLSLMSVATGWVVEIAAWVAELGPTGNVGLVPKAVFLLGVVALLIATLCRSWLKSVAIVFVCLSVVAGTQHVRPDILISENGGQVGLVHESGNIILVRPNAEKFTAKIWRQAFGNGGQSKDAEEQFRCDRVGCVARMGDITIVQLKTTAQFTDDCRMADVLVVPFALQNPCGFLPEGQRPTVIDGRALQSGGSHALSIAASEVKALPQDAKMPSRPKIDVKIAYPRSNRPWNTHRSS